MVDEKSDMTEKLLADVVEHDADQDVDTLAMSMAKHREKGSTVQKRIPGTLQLAGLLISLSSFLWGFGVTVLNVCIVEDAPGSLLVDINLSTTEQETATALVLIGAALTALTTSGINEFIGLKKMILLNNVFFISGAIVCALALDKRAIFVGRLLIGIGCGIVTNTVPILLSEISPAFCRGRLTSLHQLNLTFGILCTGVLGFFIINDVIAGWRYLNGFMVVPALMQVILCAFIPESPWWLMQQRRRRETKQTLEYLREFDSPNQIESELHKLSKEVQGQAATQSLITWAHMWKYKKPLILGSILVFFQAMTGINTVILYSAKIFQIAHISNPFTATIAVDFVNVFGALVSVYVVDTSGRKPIMVIGTVIMIAALLTLSSSLLSLNDHTKEQGLLAVMGVLIFVGGFAISLGPVVWILLTEITPVELRSRCFALYMGVNYLCNILIAEMTLSVIKWLGQGHQDPEKNGVGKLYLILAGVSIGCLVFIIGFVEETRGLPVCTMAYLDSREVKERNDTDELEQEGNAEHHELIGDRTLL